MKTQIDEIKRVFVTRLKMLSHLLEFAENNCSDINGLLSKKLAPDMHTLGTQIAFACNQPLSFAQWCKGREIKNLDPNFSTIDVARDYIRSTISEVDSVSVSDEILYSEKRTALGPNLYCEIPGTLYYSDYLLPNFYFHITTAYAIIRNNGVPLGKANFMQFLGPHVKQVEA